MGGESGMHGREEKCTHNFGWESVKIKQPHGIMRRR
jgi:hypothetical protein